MWGERVDEVGGFYVGQRVAVTVLDKRLLHSLGGTVAGTIDKLWEDGAAYVKLDSDGSILGCGICTFKPLTQRTTAGAGAKIPVPTRGAVFNVFERAARAS